MSIIEVALTQVYVKEIPGSGDNPEISKYFIEMGFDADKMHDETAWCSAYVNGCVIQVNRPHSGQLNARSWLQVGHSAYNPRLGDVVVFWRESRDSWKGHVGFFITARNGLIYTLGSNQNNAVRIAAYPRGRVLEYRRL